MKFSIDVISLKGKLFTGEADEISLPSVEGELTILANHMPFVAPLTTGEVYIKTQSGPLQYSIGKGVFSIINNNATLLIEDVLSADEISEEKADTARKQAEEIIAKGIQGAELERALYTLRRSLIDIKIAHKKRKAPIT